MSISTVLARSDIAVSTPLCMECTAYMNCADYMSMRIGRCSSKVLLMRSIGEVRQRTAVIMDILLRARCKRCTKCIVSGRRLSSIYSRCGGWVAQLDEATGRSNLRKSKA